MAISERMQERRSNIPQDTLTGRSWPLGSTPCDKGTNFSLFSRNATGIELLLFDSVDDAKPARTIRFDPGVNRTYHYWHAFVPDVTAGANLRLPGRGPVRSGAGSAIRSQPRSLLDPYGRGVVVPKNYSREAARRGRRQSRDGHEERGRRSFRLRLGRRCAAAPASSRTIIYEMHVRGFTRHPSSGVPERHAAPMPG